MIHDGLFGHNCTLDNMKESRCQKEKASELVLTLYVLLRSIQLLSTSGLWSCLRLHSYCKQTPRSQSDTQRK